MRFFLLTLLTLIAAAIPLDERDTTCCGCIPPKCKRDYLPTPMPAVGALTAVLAAQTPAPA
jgi:hypothetical protein